MFSFLASLFSPSSDAPDPESPAPDEAEPTEPRGERLPLVLTEEVLFPSQFIPLTVLPEGRAAVEAAREQGLDTLLVASPADGEAPRFATRVSTMGMPLNPDKLMVQGLDRVALTSVRHTPWPSAVVVELPKAEQPDEDALCALVQRALLLPEPPKSARWLEGEAPDGPRWVDKLLAELVDVDTQRKLLERPILGRMDAVMSMLPEPPSPEAPTASTPTADRDVLGLVLDPTPCPVASRRNVEIPRAGHALVVPVPMAFQPGTRFDARNLLQIVDPDVLPAVRHLTRHAQSGCPVLLVRRTPGGSLAEGLASDGTLFLAEYLAGTSAGLPGVPDGLSLGGEVVDPVQIDALHRLPDGTLVATYRA